MTSFNCQISMAKHATSKVTLVSTVEPTTQKKELRSHAGTVKYLLKKFSNDHAVAEMSFEILQYTQPAHMAPMQYTVDLYAKSHKVVDVYDKSASNNIFIEAVNSSTCHSRASSAHCNHMQMQPISHSKRDRLWQFKKKW